MSLINIDLKSEGIDPAKVSDILSRVDRTMKYIEWISLAAMLVIKQAAAKFHFDLPPETP